MTHKNLRNIASLLVALLVWSGTASAHSYKVKSTTGDVTWYNMQRGTLDPAKTGQILGIGTLIHVGSNGGITFEAVDEKEKSVDQIKILELKSPGVMRLPASLRESHADQYPLKDLPTGSAPPPDSKPSLDFRQAWERLTAILLNPADKKSLPKVAIEAPDLDINTAGYLGKIQWHYPLGDLTVHSRMYPRSIEIFWKSEPEHGGTYRVYFWPMNKSRAPSLDSIKSDRYNLMIPTEGSYYLQVTSDDGKYRSQKRVIHAAAPGKNGDGVKPARQTELVNLKRQAGEMLPPDNFVIFGVKNKTPITLSWKFPEVPGSVQPTEYQVQFTDKKTGKDVFNHRTKATSTTFQLVNHGQYEWQVTAYQGTTYQKSTYQNLTFIEAAGPEKAITAFLNNINARKPGTFLVNSEKPE